MTAPKKHWYLIAYDVREPKRLQRVHYYLRKRALAVQKSVFIIEVDEAGMREVETELRARVRTRDDDLRLYAIPNPTTLWAAGQQNEDVIGLYGGEAPPPRKGKSLRRWFQGLFGREAA